MPDWPFFGYFLYNAFGEYSKSVTRKRNYDIRVIKHLSKCVGAWKGCKSKDTRSSHYILCLWLFLSWVPLQSDRRHDVTVSEKFMEFNLLIGVWLIYVSCKFEMLIYETSLVIKQYMYNYVSFCTHCMYVCIDWIIITILVTILVI